MASPVVEDDDLSLRLCAQGSAYEVRCQIFIARDLGFLLPDESNLLLSKIDEISRMMIAFQKKLKAQGYRPDRALRATCQTLFGAAKS